MVFFYVTGMLAKHSWNALLAGGNPKCTAFDFDLSSTSYE